jgi:large exoprotein involved in heme utilization and adhesion
MFLCVYWSPKPKKLKVGDYCTGALVVSSDSQSEDSANLIGQSRAVVNTFRQVQQLTNGDSTIPKTAFERELGFGNAGNIDVSANNITLENSAEILAETASGAGGNIDLDVQGTLLMLNESLISTTAGTAAAGGDGGNININAQFVIAPPNTNNDIIANAFEGSGGNINITAAGVFGFDVRNENNPRQDSRNNLSASSQFGSDGDVDTPNVDPQQGVNNLPTNLADPTNQMDRSCIGNQNLGQFTIAGRGGLPPQPGDVLPAVRPLVDLGPGLDQLEQLDYRFSNRPSSAPVPVPDPSPSPTLIEAQGIQVGPDGTIQLVANPSGPQILASGLQTYACS